MSSPLHLDVFVVPYKPITGLIPPMSTGEPTWPATSVSLISGERGAVLIDAVLAPEDAGRVAERIRATGKNLTTIYITHGHGDHFFGLTTLLAAFPDARAVTTAAVVPGAQEQLSPDLMKFWNAILPGQIPEHPIVPDALDGDVIDLEGHQLHIITVGQADTAPSTIVHIPDLDAVIAGDVAYNGIHQWLADTDHEKRMQWIASVEQVEALDPAVVVASHKRPRRTRRRPRCRPRRHQDLRPRLRPVRVREPFGPGTGRQDDGTARRPRQPVHPVDSSPGRL